MKIIKYSKMKDGMYKLELDDSGIIKNTKLNEELILKNNLLITKEIDEETLLKLENDNIKYEAYNLAIRHLKTRQRCNKEINDYLNSKGYGKDIIDEVIKILEYQGYLNEDIYITSYINDKINLTNDGPLKIEKELEQKGLNKNVIKDKLMVFDENLEFERVDRIINKLMKSNNKSNFNFKMKCKNNLFNLGYHDYIVYRCLEGIDIDDGSSREKEYDKLYKKYSKKYNGNELEYKIKQALYQKGYRD